VAWLCKQPNANARQTFGKT